MHLQITTIALLCTTLMSFLLIPNAVFTTFVAYYPDDHLAAQKIFIRGDGCNLTWSKGVVLNKTAVN